MSNIIDHIKAIQLSAQIDVLLELEHKPIYVGNDDERRMKSVVFMDEVINKLSEKRVELAKVNRDNEVSRLKNEIKQLNKSRERIIKLIK
jgi:hypothetical protein